MARDGSDLCTACGLCCNGALFADARAWPEEMERIRAAGVGTVEEEGRTRFLLPCPRLEGNCCTIYETRFRTCRAFRCQLLNRYLAGDVEQAEALARIGEAKAMLAETVAEFPEAALASGRKALMGRFAGWPRLADAAERARFGAAFLKLMRVHRFLELHFYKPRDRSEA
jgi:uncharacterized protein